jgi:regulator of replication initiation timing
MGLSLTVLEERAEKMEEENKALLMENKSLVARWLAKIKDEAETMNDANEFLERIRGMRMSSPADGEDISLKEKPGGS